MEYYEYKVDEFATLISDIGERLKELEKMIDVPRINKKKVLDEINNLIRKVVPYEWVSDYAISNRGYIVFRYTLTIRWK